MLRALLVVCALSLPAHADEPRVDLAVAVNTPLMWVDGKSMGGSLYIGAHEHFTLRLNGISHEYGLIDGAFGEASFTGRTRDLGLGFVYFPKRNFDGLSLEVGYTHRSIDGVVTDINASPEYAAEQLDGHLARGFVGYSLLIEKRVFIAAAIGGAVGRYTGSETMGSDVFEEERMTRAVNQVKTSFESYLRFGVTFGG